MGTKMELLPVNMSADIEKPDGSFVVSKQSMVYLGSGLSADGRNGSEINRRLGAAKADFLKLRKVWAHSNISREKKLRIYNACIVSSLSYGLMTMVFTKVEERRIDGFHCRCLRAIHGIAPAYWSRVSNSTVLHIARQQPLTDLLRKQRMIYIGEVARRPATDCIRNLIFEFNSTKTKYGSKPRPRGQPRKNLVNEVMRDCLALAGSQSALNKMFYATPAATAAWRRAVQAGVVNLL